MIGLEESLKQNGIYVTSTKGDSMQPMLVEGRDKVVIVPPVFPLKKHDIPVYRKQGHYTMHRIVKVTKKGYIICADNRGVLETTIRESDIVGMLEGFYQGDKYIGREDEAYLEYAKLAEKTLFKRVLKRYTKRAIEKLRSIKKGQ